MLINYEVDQLMQNIHMVNLKKPMELKLENKANLISIQEKSLTTLSQM